MQSFSYSTHSLGRKCSFMWKVLMGRDSILTSQTRTCGEFWTGSLGACTRNSSGWDRRGCKAAHVKVVARHNVPPVARELGIGDGRDNLREEGSVGRVLGLLKHLH
eukprot:scaffold33950_cov29-Tisochrysis_lutea.AAC.4